MRFIAVSYSHELFNYLLRWKYYLNVKSKLRFGIMCVKKQHLHSENTRIIHTSHIFTAPTIPTVATPLTPPTTPNSLNHIHQLYQPHRRFHQIDYTICCRQTTHITIFKHILTPPIPSYQSHHHSINTLTPSTLSPPTPHTQNKTLQLDCICSLEYHFLNDGLQK